ncbi:hypothetical protein IAU59_006280 [Kwoniella sp. CBS 9459]
MSSAPLKSALKKSTKSSSSRQQVPASAPVVVASSSASTLKNNTHANSKSKAKHSITIASKSKGKSGKASARKAAAPVSESDDDDEDEDEDDASEGNAPGFEDVEMGDPEASEEMDTDEEIERSKEKGVKPPKRKRTMTTADTFGATLTSLLADPMIKKQKKSRHRVAEENQGQAEAKAAAPTDTAAVGKSAAPAQAQAPIMALSAHKPPTQASVSLEAKARRALKAQKEEKEDQARVLDVLEGWSNGDGVVGGQEFERGLRKTAQRGVIKLFNAILQASKNAEEVSSTLPLSAQAKLKPEQGKKKEKDNILGRGGKEDVLTKESFLDMVRKGSTR